MINLFFRCQENQNNNFGNLEKVYENTIDTTNSSITLEYTFLKKGKYLVVTDVAGRAKTITTNVISINDIAVENLLSDIGLDKSGHEQSKLKIATIEVSKDDILKLYSTFSLHGDNVHMASISIFSL